MIYIAPKSRGKQDHKFYMILLFKFSYIASKSVILISV